MLQLAHFTSATSIRDAVRSAVSTALDLRGDEPGDAALLTTLGMDSIRATEIACLLSDSFDLALPATIAFDYPSVDAMTRRVIELMSAKLRAGEPESLPGKRVASGTGRRAQHRPRRG
jgi:acyl carrier protein